MCVRACMHACVHVFEDVGMREFSRHIGLESLVRRDNMEEDDLLGKGEGERGRQDGVSVPLVGQNPFGCHVFLLMVDKSGQLCSIATLACCQNARPPSVLFSFMTPCLSEL